MIILLCILIYIISVAVVAMTYSKKDIWPSFWSLLFLFTPMLNTILAIKFRSLLIDDFNEFMNKINKE